MKLLQNFNTRLDQKITRLYGSYKKQRIKALEKELSTLVAKEKALWQRIKPIRERIQEKQAEILRLRKMGT